MKDRDLLIEDLQDIETVLLALNGVGPELSDEAIKKVLARTCYHVLTHAVHVIDREGRKERQ